MTDLKFNLQLFNDGAAATGGEEGNMADNGLANQQTGEEGQQTEPTPRDLKSEFDSLIKGEYKDLYEERLKSTMDRRFKATKQTEARLQEISPVLDVLAERYGVKQGDVQGLMNALDNDHMYLEQQADEAGLTIEQYKHMKQLERQAKQFQDFQQQQERDRFINEQFQKWTGEAEQVANIYPTFDFSVECDNPQFMSLLKAGIPVKHAYETLHMEDIKNSLISTTAQSVEEKVANNIRAKGNRPSENGASGGSGITTTIDVSKLSLKEMQDLNRRAARGEKISFS